MLELKNIGKTFNPGTVNEKIALEGVNLHLDDGDFATIVGSNGAGKSTLFNAIAGEFIADTGTITLAGKDITFLPDYKRSKAIGRMFQDPLRGTAPHMTIEENLALAFLRASGHTSPFSRITQEGPRPLCGKTLRAGHGAGGPDEPAGGPAVRRPAPGADPDDGHAWCPRSCCCWTSTPPPWTRPRRTKCWILTTRRVVQQQNHLTTLMVTHNMKNALDAGQPHPDDGPAATSCWTSAARSAPTPPWAVCWTALPRTSAMRWIMTEFC